MKKLFLMMLVAACSFAAMATNYAGRLNVAVDGEGTAQGAEIAVVKNGETYDLTLKNFMLASGDVTLPVGTIELKGCTATEEYGLTTIKYDGNVNIAAGDLEGVDAEGWIGPMLGAVPIKMTANFIPNVLSVGIDINFNMGDAEQVINVDFMGLTAIGDVNGDGKVNSSDAGKVVEQILAQ